MPNARLGEWEVYKTEILLLSLGLLHPMEGKAPSP